jgi:hypothetical protein
MFFAVVVLSCIIHAGSGTIYSVDKHRFKLNTLHEFSPNSWHIYVALEKIPDCEFL